MHISLTHGGGVEKYTQMLIEHTAVAYDTVLVCDPDYKTDCFQAFTCKVLRVVVPKKIALVADFKAAAKIRCMIKAEKPDIVYCHSAVAGAIGRVAALGMNCKTVYNAHGWAFDMDVSKKKKWLYCFLERILAWITDEIVTISEHDRKSAIDKKICKENKIRVILNGINRQQCVSKTPNRGAFGYKETDFIVGCAARIAEQKDPLLFAETAGILAKRCPDAKFIWVGEGELHDAFLAALQQNGVLEKTWITGWVDAPAEYIGLFDVAVLFSKWEGFGLCLAEYLALGKPVVATHVGGISEVVEDGVCGKLMQDRNPQRLAEEILAYRNKALIPEIRRNCIEHSKKFDFQVTAQKTCALFEELLRR